MKFPKKLQQKLDDRNENNALRSLSSSPSLVDFSSNDYLGFAKSEEIFDRAHQFLVTNNTKLNGATGSRLLTGNYDLYDEVERSLCDFYKSEDALIFNSGYDANVGIFSSVPQKGDIVLYDKFIHASIRDGIRMSNTKAHKFKHNDLQDLEEILNRTEPDTKIYVVTESVFSMDGDAPDLIKMVQLCKKYKAYLIVDEAHAVGVFGSGITEKFNLEDEIFARIITFGKALGCHGAAVLGSKELKQYLINFARSFIYTTSLPAHSLATIKIAHEDFATLNEIESSPLKKLTENIKYFQSEVRRLNLNFINSESAIHCCVISGNESVKTIAKKIQVKGFDVRPILSPTVPKGKERLRFCLHAYNSKEEITKVLENLATFVAR